VGDEDETWTNECDLMAKIRHSAVGFRDLNGDQMTKLEFAGKK